MKPRWLLWAVAVVCALVLVPVSGLGAQGIPLGCGTPDIDGVLSAGEWDAATVVPMAPVTPNTDADMLLMNNQDEVFVALVLNANGIVADPARWLTRSMVCFADEPLALDDVFAQNMCPTSEGCYVAREMQNGPFVHGFQFLFRPFFEHPVLGGRPCPPQVIGPGVASKAGPAMTLAWEWGFDLGDSHIDAVDAGDCFLLGTMVVGVACADGTACGTIGGGAAMWPASFFPPIWPDGYAAICMDPCADDC